MGAFLWRYDTQHKYTQENDIQHNNIQHNVTQHTGLVYDIQHKWTFSITMFSVIMLHVAFYLLLC